MAASLITIEYLARFLKSLPSWWELPITGNPMILPRISVLILSAMLAGPFLTGFAEDGFAKVLFLGNSITKHGPKPEIDWLGNWGMAASEEGKDYVHLVTKQLAAKQGKAPEIMVQNIADFEKGYRDYDLAARIKDAVAFEADLIILAIGENVPALATPEDQVIFSKRVTELLTMLKGDRSPTILVRSCFWANETKDGVLRQACDSVEGVFVDIRALGKEEAHHARSERPFKHEGVADHPGDQGMEAIARAIWQAIPE